MITILLLIKYQVIDIKSNEPPFEYEDKQIVIDTMYLFEKYVNVGDDYVDYYINDGSKFEKSIVKEIKNVEEKYNIGEFEQYDQYIYAIDFDIQNVDYKIQNYKHSVRVMVTNHAENRDVYITVWFKENPEYYIKLDQADTTPVPRRFWTNLDRHLQPAITCFWQIFTPQESRIPDLFPRRMSVTRSTRTVVMPSTLATSTASPSM